MNHWEPSYRGEPGPGNRTFALVQKAIDNGWTPYRPGSKIEVLEYRFYFFLNAQYMEVDTPSFIGGEKHTTRLNVSEIIFSKNFAKALVGKDRYRKLLQGAVLSRSPIDYMYREAIDRKARIGSRI